MPKNKKTAISVAYASVLVFFYFSAFLLVTENQKINMLFSILKVLALLAIIIVPLWSRKNKKKIKPKSALKNNTDTTGSLYAVNENGALEKVHRISLTDH